MHAQRTCQKFQVYFIAFPGYRPTFPDGLPGIFHSAMFDVHPDDDEAISDGAMKMADWALEQAPELFGLDAESDDYEAYNDTSERIAGEIMGVLDGKTRVEGTPENPACFWRWVQDTQIAEGVVVRAAYFEYEER